MTCGSQLRQFEARPIAGDSTRGVTNPCACRHGAWHRPWPLEPSAALDAGAADDCVGPVFEAHPGLALAVVVGRPHDEGRPAPADLHRLRAFGVGPAPDAHERVRLALASDR